MLCHDATLESYTVSGSGENIRLTLAWYADHKKIRENTIEFVGVVLDEFLHLEGTIINSIDELPLKDAEEQILKVSEKLCRLGGKLDSFGNQALLEGLCEMKCHCWLITAAIGFEGIAVGKSVTESAV